MFTSKPSSQTLDEWLEEIVDYAYGLGLTGLEERKKKL
jgi:hypothetical protein